MARRIVTPDRRRGSHIAPQVVALRGWVRTRLWAQVLVGLVLGVLIGALISPDVGLVEREAASLIGSWLALPGQLFLGLISLSLVTLVFVSILQGLVAPKEGGQLRSIGIRLAVIVLTTTTIAAVLGVVLTQIVQPGAYITGFEAPETVALQTEERIDRRLPDLIAGLLPTNIAQAVMDRDMLAIVVLAVLFGIACRQANARRIEVLLKAFDGLLEIAMLIVKWAMYLTPWAVLGLMAQAMAEVGVATVAGMAAYLATVIAGLLVLLLIYLALVGLVARTNPLRFLAAIAPVQLLAFSTSSSAAVMPLSIETAAKKLGVPSSTADVVIPLGATMNMAGTALYQSVAVLFLAQMTGVELAPGQIAAVVGTLVVSSIGAPGTPGVSIAILATVVSGLGIPTAGVVLILGVDRLLDMCRTVVNVTGDLTACLLLKRVPTG